MVSSSLDIQEHIPRQEILDMKVRIDIVQILLSSQVSGILPSKLFLSSTVVGFPKEADAPDPKKSVTLDIYF